MGQKQTTANRLHLEADCQCRASKAKRSVRKLSDLDQAPSHACLEIYSPKGSYRKDSEGDREGANVTSPLGQIIVREAVLSLSAEAKPLSR